MRAPINLQYGLLHLEMHVFTDFVQHAIAEGDREIVRLSLMMAERYYHGGSAHLSNAIYVSFLEHLDLREARWAWAKSEASLPAVY